MSNLGRQLILLAIGLAACGGDQATSGVRDASVTDSGTIPFRDAGSSVDGGASDAGAMNPAAPALGAQIDRMGRPAITTALIGPLLDEPVKGQTKDAYNKAGRGAFTLAQQPIARSLAIYDALDGYCGNQLLADPNPIPERYFALASLLADDRLLLNAESVECIEYLAVELSQSGAGPNFATDCGGRAPDYDVIDCTYSAMVIGSWTGVSDGVDRDDHAPSQSTFPFLAPPD